MLETMGAQAKQAAYQLAQLSTQQKNAALLHIAKDLITHQDCILAANQKDIQTAQANKMSEAMQDRLLLTPARLQAIADDVQKVCILTDPVGEIIDGRVLENGLSVQRQRVPLGVIGVIYEARPNVTIDVATLCIKTGNAVILRGGKETIHTNQVLVDILQEALIQSGLPAHTCQFISDPDRKWVTALLKLSQYVDMIIPRGGAALQQFCQENATIPVILGGIGVCHLWVDETADVDKALPIILNAKTQRPSTCNTLETLLIHQKIADTFLPKLSQAMAKAGVTLHVKESLLPIMSDLPAKVQVVTEEALSQEWLSLDLNVVMVDDLTAAITHIRRYGSGHSEGILTTSLSSANYFVQQVDAAAVYVNTSTRFTDGAQFGLGAEVAVSTQKLHARGPMGLEALTTYKWICRSDGLTRS